MFRNRTETRYQQKSLVRTAREEQQTRECNETAARRGWVFKDRGYQIPVKDGDLV